MKKLYGILLTLLLGLSSLVVSAQNLEHLLFATGTDSTRWIPLTTTTSLITSSGDGVASALQDLGIEFVFDGVTYTQFSVNSDGNLRFGNTVTGTASYTTPFSASNANINNPKINMLGCDGYFTAGTNHIYYELIGTAPNRIAVIEFAASTYTSASRSAILRWQVQLFEGTNEIQIVYHNSTPTIMPAVARQIGMCSSSSNIVIISADHQMEFNPESTGTANIPIGTWPEPGRYYNFSVTNCMAFPSDATISNITETSAELTWAINDENFSGHFEVEVDSESYTTSSTSFSITGLEPNTSYIARVRTICDDENTSNWVVRRFNTAFNPASLPYSCNFEDETENGDWTILNGEEDNKFFISSAVNHTESGSNALYISSTSGASNEYNNGSASVVWAYRDIDCSNFSSVQLSFNYRNNGESSFDYLKVFVGTPTDVEAGTLSVPSGAIQLGGYHNLTSSLWKTATYAINIPHPSTYRLYFLWRNDTSGGTQPPVAIDDITIVGTNCPFPEQLVASDVTETSATISFVSNPSISAWEYVITEGDIDPSTVSNVVSITDTVFTLNGLTPDHSYNVYVRANCGDEQSAWSEVLTIRTTCPAAITELPYTEDFDSYGGSGATYFPTCWSRTTNYSTNYPYIYTNKHRSGLYSLYFYSSSTTYSIAASPAIDVDMHPINTLSCSFFFMKTSASYGAFEVGVMTNPADASTFTAVRTFTASDWPDINTWYEADINLAEYAGTGAHIAFRAPTGTSSYAYIDDVTIYETPACMKPISITASHITHNSADIHWTARNDESEWEVVAVPTGNPMASGTVLTATTNPFTIDGLSGYTQYDVYVRAICGNEPSTWSSAYTFTTLCDPVSVLPYTEDFDTYGTTSFTSFPSCWSRKTNYSSQYPYVSSNNHKSGVGALYFYGSTSAYSLAVAHAIDPIEHPINTLSCSFFILKTSASYGTFEVGVMTNPEDETTFTAVQSFSSSDWAAVNTWYEAEVDFTDYEGAGNYIAIRAGGTTTYFYMDDFSVYETRNCKRPFSVHTANVTANSADIFWTPRNDESSWEVIIVPEDGDMESSSILSTDSASIHIEDLEASTTYLAYVRAICDDGTSDWSSPTLFTTRCAATSELPYIENFDTYGGSGQTYYPTCWTRMTSPTATTQYPYIYTTYHHSGSSSLYFYSTTSHLTLATTQALDLTAYEPNSLQLSFWAYKTSASYGRLDVGVMTDPSDLSTFTTLQSIFSTDYEATSTWYEFKINLTEAYTDGPVYIAFRSPASTNYVYVDDVVLDFAPTCPTPSDVTVSNIVGTSAMISWNIDGEGADSFTVEYQENSEELDETGWALADNTILNTYYLLGGLTENTTYAVRVTSNCAEGTPEPALTTFTTGCMVGGSSEITPGTESTSSSFPVNNFYSYSYSQELFTAAELGDEKDITAIAFEYNASTPSTSKTNVNIYLGHTPLNELSTSAMVPFDSLTLVYTGNLNCQQGWNIFTLDTTFHYNGANNLVVAVDDNSGAYNGSTYTFRVYPAGATRTVYFYSDSNNPDPSTDLSSFTSRSSSTNRVGTRFISPCDPTITCVAPNAIISHIDDASITMEWVAGNGEASWTIEYKAMNDDTWTTVSNVTTSPYIFNNLTSNTTYQIRIHSNCGSENSLWRNLSATTFCATAQLPFTEDFESGTAGSSGQMVSCWSKGTNNTSTAYPYLNATNSGTPTHPGALSLYLYGTSTYYSYAATPEFDASVDMSNLIIRFEALRPSANYIVEVGVMTDPTDVNTFTVLGTVSPSATSTWETMEVTTENYTGTGRYIAWRTPATATNGMYVDNVLIDVVPQCLHVTDLHTTDIQPEEVSIEWTGHIESEWEYVLIPADSILDMDNVVTSACYQASVTLTGLTENTPYKLYVRANCGSETSFWETLSFRTTCFPITALPYHENFEAFSTGTNAFPDCWRRLNNYSTTSQYPYCSATNAHNGSRSLYYFSSSTTYNMAILTPVDITTIPMNSLMVSFYMKPTNVGFGMIVGIMSDPSDLTTFEPIDTVFATSTTAHQLMEVAFNNYTGTGRYVALKGINTSTSATSLYLDDVTLDLIPTCVTPIDLGMADVSTSSVTLEWTERANSTTWEIEYGPAGFTQGTGTIVTATENPFEVTGLTSSTIYDFYVRAVCSATEQSSWTNKFTAGTECTQLSAPYYEDFESYIGTTYNTAGPTPHCWSTWSNNYTYGAPHVIGSSSYLYPHSGTQALIMTTGSAGSDAYAVLPEFEGNLSDYTVSFWYRMESATSGTLTVGYTTDAVLVSTNFTPLSVGITNITSVDSIAIDLSSYTFPANARFAFHWNYASSYYSVNLDDIRVELNEVAPATCDVPTNLSVAAEQTSAVVTWTAGGDETAWNLQYKAASSNNWSASIPTTTPTYTLTGLTANTTYDVRVQANCGDELTSDWATSIFTTQAEDACPTPTNFAATSTENNSVVLAWNQEPGTASEWGINYKKADAQDWTSITVTTNPYTITDLESDATYQAQIEAHCDNGSVSGASDMITFTITGINDYLMQSTTLFPNPANSTITIVNNSVMMQQVDVYDVYGKLLSTTEVNGNSVSINVANFADGMYFARILTDKGIVTKNFIKK